MRFDNLGLFWQDVAVERGKSKRVRPQPPIPNTGWERPRSFPNLKDCKSISIDTETFDPELKTCGAGWARGVGHIVGLSVSVRDGHKWYFPMRHEINPEDNMEPEHVLHWAKDNITQPEKVIIGANLPYDVGWLRQEGVDVRGKLYDVLHAEALLDDNRRSYNLDSVSEQYLGLRKVSDELYRWSQLFYGGSIKDQRANIYRCPPCLVGPYAEEDAYLPFEILKKQWKLMELQGLLDVFDMESRLIPLMVDMRFRGVRVDLDKAEEARDKLLKKEQEAQKALDKCAGMSVSVNAPKSIERVFKKEGWAYGKTDQGNASFTKPFLTAHKSKVAKGILNVRKFQKARRTFIENYIFKKHVDGRLYCDFPQLKGDDGGTVSGRFASRMPNLQNIPSRDTFIKELVRGLFVPDHGFEYWGRIDLSQIEYRFLAHFAIGKGSNEIRRMYEENPKTDYHQATVDLIYAIVNILLERKPAKTVNFGLVYGMGEPTMCAGLGISRAKGAQLFSAYHKGVPFVKETFDHYMEVAQKTGVLTTILGRRSRFVNWESFNYQENKGGRPLGYEEAFAKYGGHIQRAFTHKSLNRQLQGSAADWMKMAMVIAYEGGVFDELGGPPHLTVHDELDFSFNMDQKTGIQHLKESMETAMELRVPVLADMERGRDWGHCKSFSLAA